MVLGTTITVILPQSPVLSGMIILLVILMLIKLISIVVRFIPFF